jgi:serine/threonine-protein kinase
MTNYFVNYNLNGITFNLKEHIDFSWLHEMGSVFSVFDQQDSGNICFGIEDKGQKMFVKFAGVRTVHYNGDPQDAVSRLKDAVQLYYELKHPSLIEIKDHFQVGSGYAVIFEWFDGMCLHPHWSYPPPAKYTDPNSPFYRYKELSVSERLQSLDSIFSFHVFVEEKNYVAIDFYDGSILYSFSQNQTKICDIDFYQKRPFYNTMGRLWGSSRFMSPEEFQLGAEIDSLTNVFNMGAVAFALLGGELDRSFSKWEASKELYNIASKAIENDRAKRYQSLSEFFEAWSDAGLNEI